MSETKQKITPYWHQWRNQHFIYRNEDDVPVVGLRFELIEVHKRRADTDREFYKLHHWNSWIKTETGSEVLVWPSGTDIEEMKKQIESKDVRIPKGPQA